MKRLLAFFLATLMLVSLAACGGKEAPVTEETQTGTDLTKLDGASLYRYGVEKAAALKSARYTTVLSLGEETLDEMETVRIRSGYDSFLWSRTGKSPLYFDGKTAWVETPLGKYTAEATSRLFQEYLDECVYPVSALTPEGLEQVKREGSEVSYESKNTALLARFAPLSDGFAPASLTGKATFSKEGIITAESIEVTGANEAGEETVFLLKTTLDAFRSEAIVTASPQSTEGFVTVSDIRLPWRVQNAMNLLLTLPQLQATLVVSATASLGDQKFSLNRDITAYQNGQGAYLSRQSLKNVPEVPEESLFYQCLAKDGTKTENTYNVLLGEKLSENTCEGSTVPWQDELRAVLPALSGLASLSVVEDVEGYSVTFALTEAYAEGFADKVASLFDGAIAEVKDVAAGECTGTLSIRKSDLVLGALSYTVGGVFRSGDQSGTFQGRYSVLLDRTEEVTLPELQTPTATVPGQLPDHLPDELC